MKKLTPIVAVAVAVVAALAWSADASAIIGGTTDPAPSSVVAISGQTSGGATGLVCTGTLVAPNVVLTARHCVEEGDPSCTDTFTGAAKYVAISITTDANAYPVSATRVPTGTKPCGDDIALLVLSSPVPSSDGSPVADVRLTPAKGDEAYSAVGYGWTCAEGAATCSSKGTRHRKDGLAVGCIDCRDGTWRGTSDVTCVGDSGGPAFDAHEKVLGVTSVGGLGCTTAHYTRLDTHADWLRETVTTETTKASVATPAWTTANGDSSPDAGGRGDAGPPNATPSGATPSSTNDEGGCVVAPRSVASRSSTTRTSLFVAAVVLLTWACRRSTKRARTTTSSARATRSIAGRTIRADTTRSWTISKSSSSRVTAPARTSSNADAGRVSSSNA